MQGPEGDPGINIRTLQALFEQAAKRSHEAHITHHVSMVEVGTHAPLICKRVALMLAFSGPESSLSPSMCRFHPLMCLGHLDRSI